MPLPTVRHFCCCLSLKTGAVFIGALQMTFGVALLADMASKAHHPHYHDQLADDVSEDDIRNQRGACVVAAMSAMAHILLSGLLMYGAEKGKAALLKPWMTLTMVNTVLIILILTTIGLLCVILGMLWLTILLMVLLLPFIGLSAYGQLVVYSYYRTLVADSPGLALTELGTTPGHV